jgi:hypothetical protein
VKVGKLSPCSHAQRDLVSLQAHFARRLRISARTSANASLKGRGLSLPASMSAKRRLISARTSLAASAGSSGRNGGKGSLSLFRGDGRLSVFFFGGRVARGEYTAPSGSLRLGRFFFAFAMLCSQPIGRLGDPNCQGNQTSPPDAATGRGGRIRRGRNRLSRGNRHR